AKKFYPFESATSCRRSKAPGEPPAMAGRTGSNPILCNKTKDREILRHSVVTSETVIGAPPSRILQVVLPRIALAATLPKRPLCRKSRQMGACRLLFPGCRQSGNYPETGFGERLVISSK